MSEGEKKSIENLANILTELPDFEKGRLLGYGERIADEKEKQTTTDSGGGDD